MKLIRLTKGHEAMVDDEDYDLVSAYRWNSKKHGNTVYAQRGFWLSAEKRVTTLRMARVICGLGLGDPRVVDHIDGNGLNNQRSNLRICRSNTDNIRAQRIRTTSGKSSQYRGVTHRKHTAKSGRKLWAAQISIQGKMRQIGRFLTETDAALAYNRVAAEAFGEYARLNNVSQPT